MKKKKFLLCAFAVVLSSCSGEGDYEQFIEDLDHVDNIGLSLGKSGINARLTAIDARISNLPNLRWKSVEIVDVSGKNVFEKNSAFVSIGGKMSTSGYSPSVLVNCEGMSGESVNVDFSMLQPNTGKMYCKVTSEDGRIFVSSVKNMSVVNVGERRNVVFDMSDSHEVVDLNLPSGTLWATMNVGADFMYDFGDFYAWGEVESKSEFTAYNYSFYNGSAWDVTTYYKYSYNDMLEELDLEDDAAYVNWGENWIMPSMEQFDELVQNTVRRWIWNYMGHPLPCMVYFKAKNENDKGAEYGYHGQYMNYTLEEDPHVILVCGGRIIGNTVNDYAYYGYYWTNQCHKCMRGYNEGMRFCASSNSTCCDYEFREYGHMVRPILRSVNE